MSLNLLTVSLLSPKALSFISGNILELSNSSFIATSAFFGINNNPNEAINIS